MPIRILRPSQTLSGWVWFWLLLPLLVAALTQASRLAAVIIADVSLIWPASGLALGMALRFGWMGMVPVGIGLIGWGVWQYGMIPGVFAGISITSPALLYFLLGLPPFRKLQHGSPAWIVFLILGSALTSLLMTFAMPGQEESLLDVWLIYWLADATGYLLFTTLVTLWLDERRLLPPLLAATVVYLGSLVLLATLLVWFGIDSIYARSIQFLALPWFAWLATRGDETTLTTGLAGHVTLELYLMGHGVAGYQAPDTLFPLVQSQLLLGGLAITALLLFHFSEGRRQLLAHFASLAEQDTRTKLYNDRGLLSHISGQNRRGWLVAIRLRGTSGWVGSLGWPLFLRLEAAVATRLQALVENAPLARVGEGTFVYFVPDRPQRSVWQPMVETLSLQLDGQPLHARFVMGVAPLDIEAAETLTNAVAAASLAELEAHGGWFDVAESRDELKNQRQLVNRHQRYIQALDEGGLVLVGQTIRSLDDQTDSFEVLMRLRVDGKVLMPGEVLPVFSALHDMTRLDFAVLNGVADYLRQYGEDIQSVERISVNVSGATVAQPDFARRLLALWESVPWRRERIVLELTESEHIPDRDSAMRQMRLLREAGFKVAVDDFGTGEATFAYLRDYDADFVKIDGSFIRNLLNSSTDQAMVRAIADICRTSRITSVAEFVEDDATARLLRELGIDYAQGFGIARPAPLESFRVQGRS